MSRIAVGVRVKTLATLGLLSAALPANLVVTAVAWARSRSQPEPPAASPRRTVLVTGGKMTKSLALCRAFHAAGHRVVLVETAKYRFTGHRFSRAVDAFHVVPSPTAPEYAQALLDIVRTEGVDVFVPVCSPLASRYDARAGEVLAPYCDVLHGDAATVDALDDKAKFAHTAGELGLAVPDTHRVESAEQVASFDFGERTYVLKNLAYDPVNRLDLTPLPRPTPDQTLAFARSKGISAENPWILQEFVRGHEYCTHATVRDGRLLVHACCESSAFQLNYAMVDHADIEKWVRGFVEPLGLTGQISLDLIVDDAGVARAIECNPRTHSAITMFYGEPLLAAAYLGDLDPRRAPLTPPAENRPTYWLYWELWRMLSHPARMRERWAVVRDGVDAIWDRADPLPFLLVHHLQIPALLLGNLVRGKDWTRIDFNIGKLVEPGGD